MDEEDQQNNPLPSIGSFLGYLPHLKVGYRCHGEYIKNQKAR